MLRRPSVQRSGCPAASVIVRTTLPPEPRLMGVNGLGASGVGYIKLEDLRRLLHGLNVGLPQWLVKELTSNVADLARRGRPDRVYYRDLTDVEV